MIIEIPDVWDDVAASHRKYLRSTIPKSLQKYRKHLVMGPQSRVVHDVRRYLRKHLRAIIEGDASKCIELAEGFDQLVGATCPERKSILRFLEKAFDYKKFRDKKAGWGAYALCDKARYSVCPYCHLLPTKTVTRNDEEAGYRPQLDHVLSQVKYPFLALSLGNIVPVCGQCNGPQMKFMKDFLNPVHLHPLKDAAVVRFSLKPAGKNSWTESLWAMREKMHCYEIDIDTAGDSAASQSASTFQLRTRYDDYLHDAYRIAKFAAGGRSAFSESVLATTNLHITLEDELGFPHTGDSYKHVPQGRMRRDVYFSQLMRSFGASPTAP
ncbi:hypothetical protein [Stenotrophomonas bentonitica]